MSKNPDNPELPLFDNSSDPQEPGELSLQYLQEQVEASNGEFFQGVAIGVSLNYPDFVFFVEGVHARHFTVKGFDRYWVAIMRLVRQNKDVTVKAVIKELGSTVELEHYKELSKLKDFGAKVHPDRIGDLMDFHQCGFSAFMRVMTTKPQSIKLDPDDGADEPSHKKPTCGAVVWQTAKELEQFSEPVEWVIDGLIPRGALSLMAGPPGVAKTTLCLMMLSKVSTGGRWLDGSRIKKGPVLVIASEDDLTRCIVPSIAVQGGSNDNFFVQSMNMSGTCEPFNATNPEHMKSLIAKCSIVRPKLILIDPIVDVVKGSTNDEQDVRASLAPVQRMAEECGAAVLGICHFIKAHNSRGSGTLDRVSGSGAWGRVARSVMACGEKLGEEDTFVMAKSKTSYSKPKNGGISYQVESTNKKPDGGILPNKASGRKVINLNVLDGTADQLLGDHYKVRDSEKTDDASDFLSKHIESGNPAEWDVIAYEAKQVGINSRTLRLARDSMKKSGTIKCTRIGNPSTGQKKYWHNPSMDKDAVKQALKRH